MFGHKKHLFFDLDHTLWDFEQNAAECLSQIFTDFSLDQYLISYEDFFKAFSETNQKLWYLLEQQEITHEYLRVVRFKHSLEKLNVTISHELSEQINESFLGLLPEKKGLMEGCLEVLQYLHIKYRLHILSNGFQEVQLRKLKQSGIAPFFDLVITNELAGARKPDKVIFDFALKQTHSQPKEVLMIGDSLEADIKGALNAGWDVIHFHNNKSDLESTRYQHVDKLKQILQYL